MSVQISITENQLVEDLAAFFKTLVDCDVVRGLPNWVPAPPRECVVITPLAAQGLSVPVMTYADPSPAAGKRIMTQATHWSARVDGYGARAWTWRSRCRLPCAASTGASSWESWEELNRYTRASSSNCPSRAEKARPSSGGRSTPSCSSTLPLACRSSLRTTFTWASSRPTPPTLRELNPMSIPASEIVQVVPA